MPSTVHEALVLLFRNRPSLAAELLERALGLDVPRFAEARVEEATFADLEPAEYRADLVVLLEDGVPILAIVVEVQLHRDARKRYSWPMYAVGLQARFECPVCVLVVAPSEDVAEWAREPIVLGPANTFAPLVVGPELVPIVSDEDAARDPELAVLSVLAHGRTAAVATSIAAAVVKVMHVADKEHASLYFDLMLAALGAAARQAFEELMKPVNYEYQSDFAREYFSRGRVEGKAEGKAEDVLLVLRARGVSISPENEARVLRCSDVALLERWLARAAVVSTMDALFDEAT